MTINQSLTNRPNDKSQKSQGNPRNVVNNGLTPFFDKDEVKRQMAQQLTPAAIDERHAQRESINMFNDRRPPNDDSPNKRMDIAARIVIGILFATISALIALFMLLVFQWR